MEVGEACMSIYIYIFWPISGFKGRAFELWVLHKQAHYPTVGVKHSSSNHKQSLIHCSWHTSLHAGRGPGGKKEAESTGKAESRKNPWQWVKHAKQYFHLIQGLWAEASLTCAPLVTHRESKTRMETNIPISNWQWTPLPVVVFSLSARIWGECLGECSTTHSLSVLFFFFF